MSKICDRCPANILTLSMSMKSLPMLHSDVRFPYNRTQNCDCEHYSRFTKASLTISDIPVKNVKFSKYFLTAFNNLFAASC